MYIFECLVKHMAQIYHKCFPQSAGPHLFILLIIFFFVYKLQCDAVSLAEFCFCRVYESPLNEISPPRFQR